MPFTTKLDFSNNRQVKQYPETLTVLSGATSFGVPFSALTIGPDLVTSAITETFNGIVSTFSGNSGTTIYNWYDSRMLLGESQLSALTSSNSATTQNTGIIFTSNTTTTIDGNLVVLTYSGISFDLTSIGMVNLGGGNYSGSVVTTLFTVLSAETLDFTGRTIWVDVSGITRTDRLIVSRTPQVGYVLTCMDSEGMVEWAVGSSGGTGDTSYWSASTNGIVVKNSGSLAYGVYSLAEGRQTTAYGDFSHAEGELTTASGDSSHSEGTLTKAFGNSSHAEGQTTLALGDYSHAEGFLTKAFGLGSHAEGSGTTAVGLNSHSEGEATTASGLNSHAGGFNSIASGNTSFVHGSGSTAGGIGTIVLGNGITGLTANMVYVPDLIIDGLTSQDPIATDANGKIVAGTSDIRLKQNINKLKNSLTKIKDIRGVSFEYTEESNMGGGIRYGFIAQEIEKIIPDIVRLRAKGDGMLSLNYTEIVPILVEAVKELSEKFSDKTYLCTQTILAEDNNIDLNFSGNVKTAVGGGIRVLHALGSNLSSEFIIDENGNWVTNNNLKPKSFSIPYFTPSSSHDENGVHGNLTMDNTYLYVKNENKWKRVRLEDF